MNATSNFCQRCKIRTGNLMEVWPDQNGVLFFCSKTCLEEFKLDILKREATLCLMKRRSFQEDSDKTKDLGQRKRRVTDGRRKPAKKVKEPRPHPSYRLNKRYWDDIRAGRRPHHESKASAPAAAPQALVSSSTDASLASHPVFPGPMPCLPYPVIKPPFPLSAKCLPYPFPIPSPSTSYSTPLISFAPKIKVEDEIDVISCKTEELSSEAMEASLESSSRSPCTSSALASDEDVDKMADDMMLSIAFQKKGEENESTPKNTPLSSRSSCSRAAFCPFPVPVPVPVPFFIPVTETFVLKHFATRA